MHSCNYISDNGSQSTSTFQLHNYYFRDPYSEDIPVFVSMCVRHYNLISGEMNERIRNFQMKIANMVAEDARLRKTAKMYDTYYNGSILRQKIDDLRILLKKIQTGECRNFFCMNDLNKLGQEEKIFSVHTFKPSGRRHYSYYFCCLKCFNFMKGKCGISTEIQKGQTVLS